VEYASSAVFVWLGCFFLLHLDVTNRGVPLADFIFLDCGVFDC